ncbi:Single-strand selective monofunctional uracil DNA glycosylase [Amphibalanus amphitrite]|uniref:Single-strand selective monofunctional uracil DNA glycosylase n=1 Tax=Amphibalanus amphitrite TaxID=1232801 RepID=A0A6A4WJM9_AMPAM|nr:Single-strand selective monofunctional uracil DNA glycosylase [Amphibalanus amphitrite]
MVAGYCGSKSSSVNREHCQAKTESPLWRGGATDCDLTATYDKVATRIETEILRDITGSPPNKSRCSGEAPALLRSDEQGDVFTTEQTASRADDMMNAPVPPVYVDRASQVLCRERKMSEQLRYAVPDRFDNVTHVYRPLEYAAEPHANYVRRCLGHGWSVPVLVLGMNPGPFGMCQTGVPFGEIAAVRDWMGVSGSVGLPHYLQHPNLPITGFSCRRSEVSGRRFWGLWQSRCDTPDRLFRHVYVHNFCPLAFVESTDRTRNVTPEELSGPLRQQLEYICQQALVDIINVLGVRTVVGVGRYAEDQAKKALAAAGRRGQVQVHYLMHPSDSNPQAHNDWEEQADEQLTQAGVLPFPQW